MVSPFYLRLLRDGALLFIATIVIPLFTVGAIFIALVYLPLPVEIPQPRKGIDARLSRVYDVNGEEIGVFRRFETTKPVQKEDIPQVLKDAVVAAEDERFYQHGGVDPRATLRALWNNVTSDDVQGGSTITQQYVKRTYVGSEKTFSRKVKEAILSSRIERQIDKEEVLFRYLDQVYLGEGAYGVGAAAETYFHKSVNDLNASEAALLAGLIPAPSRYEPRGNPAAAEQKRLDVLDNMAGQGYLSDQERDDAAGEKVTVLDEDEAPPGRQATVIYPRESKTDTRFPYFMDYVERYLADRYGEEAVYERGLQIYTTLDPALQAEAEKAVGDTLGGTSAPLEMSLVSVEPLTGFVKAIVGGRDFESSQVNLALGGFGGGTGRQPGSAFKPFVLATALEQGVSPDRSYAGNSPIGLGGEDFSNYGGSSYGTVSLRTATAKSINTVFVQLINDVGVEETMNIAKKMGITSAEYRPGFHGLSVALGAQEVSPLDMASAFGVIASRGERAPATPVTRVIDGEGEVVEDNIDDGQRERVLNQNVADTMNDIMRHVFDSGSTAGGKGLDRPAAGKTGTAQDLSDAWFVGYTPALSTAVWMGNSTGQVPLRGIKGVANVTGGSLPAQTWQAYMKVATASLPATDFVTPTDITDRDERAKTDTERRDAARRTAAREAPVTPAPPADAPPYQPGQNCGSGPFGNPGCQSGGGQGTISPPITSPRLNPPVTSPRRAPPTVVTPGG